MIKNIKRVFEGLATESAEVKNSRVISMEISVLGRFFDQKSQIQRVEFYVAILARIFPLMIYEPPPCPTDMMRNTLKFDR